MNRFEERPVFWPALVIVGFLVILGTTWAFERGANDFNVFFESWRLVWNGQAARVYGGTPDRYLYAPGFAWLFSPLGALDRDLALALWCFLKAASLGLLLRVLTARVGGLAFALGALTIARPLLIDFQYGQVNLLILAACCWAVLGGHGSREARPSGWDFARWFALGIAAVVKVFPLPLLAIPFFSTRGVPRGRLRFERAGAIAGVALLLLLPAVSVGLGGLPELYSSWKTSLVSRGLPLETHNQGVVAGLSRWLGSAPTEVIALHREPLQLGLGWLAQPQLDWIALGWTLMTLALLAGIVLSGPWEHRPYAVWAAACIGFLIVPSHLVWKPYFVLTLPLAAVVWRKAELELHDSQSIARGALAFVGFALINLTGFDVVGLKAAVRFEAASVMMLGHLLFLGLALWKRRPVAPTP